MKKAELFTMGQTLVVVSYLLEQESPDVYHIINDGCVLSATFLDMDFLDLSKDLIDMLTELCISELVRLGISYDTVKDWVTERNNAFMIRASVLRAGYDPHEIQKALGTTQIELAKMNGTYISQGAYA